MDFVGTRVFKHEMVQPPKSHQAVVALNVADKGYFPQSVHKGESCCSQPPSICTYILHLGVNLCLAILHSLRYMLKCRLGNFLSAQPLPLLNSFSVCSGETQVCFLGGGGCGDPPQTLTLLPTLFLPCPLTCNSTIGGREKAAVKDGETGKLSFSHHFAWDPSHMKQL
ncbi:UNVERIFIED_CONTAM: hypothetical protein K2H54_048516 [Gekko kuhli]